MPPQAKPTTKPAPTVFQEPVPNSGPGGAIGPSVSSGTYAVEIDLTPQQAVDLLLVNHCNRPLKRDRVVALARDINNGKWRYTGDAIKLATLTEDDLVYTKDGDRVPPGTEVMIDGQHRGHGLLLAAKTNPNATIRVRLERGFSYQVQRVVDAGSPRNAADLLHFERPLLQTDYRLMIALARRVYRYRAGGNLIDRHHLATIDDLFTLVDSDPNRFVKAVEYTRHHPSPRVPNSLLAWMYFTFGEADSELGPWFMLKFHTGAELPEGHPILLLRDKLDKEIDKGRRHQRKRITEAETAMYAIIAWNHVWQARKRGKPDPTFAKLQATKGGMGPSSFKIMGLVPRVRSTT